MRWAIAGGAVLALLGVGYLGVLYLEQKRAASDATRKLELANDSLKSVIPTDANHPTFLEEAAAVVGIIV